MIDYHPTSRRINLHVGVANRFIPNNVQTLEIIRTHIIKRAICQRAASATNALLEHAPHLAGVVPICKKLTRSILRFIGRYNLPNIHDFQLLYSLSSRS